MALRRVLHYDSRGPVRCGDSEGPLRQSVMAGPVAPQALAPPSPAHLGTDPVAGLGLRRWRKSTVRESRSRKSIGGGPGWGKSSGRLGLRCSSASSTPAQEPSTLARGHAWEEAAISGQTTDVLVSGAGVCGLATALALTRVGLRVLVLESRPALSLGGAALSLWANAWRALDALGVGELLRPFYIPLQQVDIFSAAGLPLRSFRFSECGTGPGGRPHEVRGVRRGHLLQVLENALPVGSVLYGSEVGGLEELPTGAVLVRVRSSDGTERSVTAQYSGYLASRGVAVLDPSNPSDRDLAASMLSGRAADGASSATEGRIRMLWGRGVRAGIYPLSPTLFYWFTCANCPANSPAFSLFERLKGDKTKQKDAALASVTSWKGGIRDIIEATPAALISTDLITDRWAFPALLGGRLGRGVVSLAGDAAHPMTPNLGQGACTALEDAVVLAQHLGRAAASPGTASGKRTLEGRTKHVREALQSYENMRSKRVAPIVLRSNALGAVLQIDNPLVCKLRDEVILPYVFSPSHFLDHALFDCGDLPEVF